MGFFQLTCDIMPGVQLSSAKTTVEAAVRVRPVPAAVRPRTATRTSLSVWETQGGFSSPLFLLIDACTSFWFSGWKSRSRVLWTSISSIGGVSAVSRFAGSKFRLQGRGPRGCFMCFGDYVTWNLSTRACLSEALTLPSIRITPRRVPLAAASRASSTEMWCANTRNLPPPSTRSWIYCFRKAEGKGVFRHSDGVLDCEPRT